MKQLVLDLDAQRAPTLSSFVIGRNSELLALLSRVKNQAVTALGERFVYFWGEAGAGKTHLLRALSDLPTTRLMDGDAGPERFAFETGAGLYLVDDCERLSPQAQIAVFNLFNQVRESGGILITTGKQPPAALNLREDLRTRLGWGLIYQLHGLSDAEKIAALEGAASARGLSLSAGVLPYLLTHFRRDLPSLMAMLDALDRYSLETKRPITLPLLRDLLHTEGGAHPVH